MRLADEGGRSTAPSRPAVSVDALGEACQDCLWLLGLDGEVRYMNPRAAQLLADPEPGGEPRDLRALWPAETRFSLDRALAAAAAGQAFRFRAFFRGGDQTRAYWETVVSPVPGADGAPELLLAVARDVTAEVETNAFLRSVIQLLPSPLTVRAVEDRRFMLVNQAAEELLGVRLDDGLGWGAHDPIVPQIADQLRKAEDEVLAAGEMRTFEFASPPDARGEERRFAVKLIATHDDDGARHLIALADDVTEQRRAAQALREALKAAELASEAKTAFLANMSHELRTPLNGVIAGADLLAREDLSEAARGLVSMIRSSSESLARLLGDVLDLARAEQGQLLLEDKAFHVGETVRSMAALFRPDAERKGLTLEVEIAGDLDGAARGDPARLHQVLGHLLSNAVKFTDNGRIVLRASRADGSERAIFAVEDTGIGFDAADKARLFGRFQQADNSSTRRFGGAGLGLAIARELVALMGGAIDAESPETGGSRFWFSLPLPPQREETGVPDRATAAEDQADRLRVLLVDDHPTNRQIVQLMLSGAAEIVCAENGAEAVETFRTRRFDLVLMDIQMPVMDGHAAVRELRRLEAEAGATRTPVIMLTANNRAENVQHSLEAGADRHLGKPVTTRALFDAIEDVLAEMEARLYQPFGHAGHSGAVSGSAAR